MDVLIKSPKITRGKGLRSVKDEVNKREGVNDRSTAYTKLFDHYLSEQQHNKIPVRKLANHEYFADLLTNKRELQNMDINLLASVLLFLDSKNDNLFNRDPRAETLDHLNNSTTKQNKSLTKQTSVMDDNKRVLDFFRYIRYVKILMDNKINEGEGREEETRMWNKARNMEMIHPHSDEQ